MNVKQPKNIFWQKIINEHVGVINTLVEDSVLLDEIDTVAGVITNSYKNGGKLLICGNGGSAADSQHLAAELVGRFLVERSSLNAEALTVNTSILTAIGNDYSFNNIFTRQVESKGKTGDVLWGISTSGNSTNIIEAIKVAKRNGVVTVGLTGNSKDSQIYQLSDYCICVPSNSTARIQEAHILIGHMVCKYIEEKLFL